MSDTQWPRWEVFKQDTPDKPHQAIGSVHAADPDHALLMARDVFVRRPKAVSLWVAPADEIFSMTQEQLNLNPDWQQEDPLSASIQRRYSIFRKASHRRSMTFVDYVIDLEATSPQHALQQVINNFTEPAALAWWVIPTEAIFRSDPDDIESWFAPALTKTYKQQAAYGFVKPQHNEKSD